MKALLVSLMLLPGLALGQFLPTSSSVTLNLDFSTDLNVDVLDFGTADGGTLHVQGTTYSLAAEVPTLASDLFNLGTGDAGTFHVSGTAYAGDLVSADDVTVTDDLLVSGIATVQDIFSFGVGDGGTLHISGPLYADDATVADDLVCTDAAEVGGAFSVAGVSSFGVADAGTVHVSGTSYLGALEVTGAGSINGLFEFDLADGGTLHLSGGAYAADLTCSDDAVVGDALAVTGVSSFNGVASFDIADGGVLHVSDSIYTANATVASSGTLTMTGAEIAFGGSSGIIDETGTTFRFRTTSSGDISLIGSTGVNITSSGVTVYDSNPDSRTLIAGDTQDDGGTVVNVRVSTGNTNVWTTVESHLFEVCNGSSECTTGAVFWVNPFGDTGQTGDAGIAGSLSAGAFVTAGTASVATLTADVANIGSADAGDGHFAGTVYAPDLTLADDALISGILSVQDVFSFGIGDGGTLHLSGPAFVDDLTTADDLTVTDDLLVSGIASVQDVFSWGISDGGTLHLSGPAYLGTTVAVGGNATMSGTLGVADVFSFGVGDGGTLHVSGTAYVSDLTAADDVTAADALNVTGLASIVTLDAGIAYAADFRSPSSNVTFGSWLTDGDSAGPAVEDRNMMGPFYSTSVPGRFGEMVCNWETAGTGGTTGVVMSVYNVTDTSVLCSCTLGACTTAAYDPLRCSCSQYFLAGKVYVGRITTATDCASNPTKIHCTVEVLR